MAWLNLVFVSWTDRCAWYCWRSGDNVLVGTILVDVLSLVFEWGHLEGQAPLRLILGLNAAARVLIVCTSLVWHSQWIALSCGILIPVILGAHCYWLYIVADGTRPSWKNACSTRFRTKRVYAASTKYCWLSLYINVNWCFLVSFLTRCWEPWQWSRSVRTRRGVVHSVRTTLRPRHRWVPWWF